MRNLKRSSVEPSIENDGETRCKEIKIRLETKWFQGFDLKCFGSLVIDGCCVEVVDEFKLLGITIDRNLHDNKYVVRLKSSVNQKL